MKHLQNQHSLEHWMMLGSLLFLQHETFFTKYNFTYLFLAVLGLRCCPGFSLVATRRGFFLVAVRRLPSLSGFSCGAWDLKHVP